jgi:predicted nucleotidyltransferase
MAVDPRALLAGGPGLRAFLESFIESIRTTLGNQLSGAYVHGSLATGSFNPRTSDIDLLITTRRLTDGATNDLLRDEYEAILGRDAERWTEMLDAAFVPASWLRQPGVPAGDVPLLHPGEGFVVGPLGPEFVIQTEMVRRYGVRLAGPPPRRATVPASAAELRQAQVDTLRARWEAQLEFPGRLLIRPYQTYAVLTMCRALYVLTYGAVVPKPEAATWVLRSPGFAEWHGLVRSVIAYPGGGPEDQRQATLAFIGFTLDEAGIVHEPPSS